MGEISAEAPANADLIIEGLEAAVAHPDTRGIVFNINSGGGSPVQSDRVWRAVQELKESIPIFPCMPQSQTSVLRALTTSRRPLMLYLCRRSGTGRLDWRDHRRLWFRQIGCAPGRGASRHYFG